MAFFEFFSKKCQITTHASRKARKIESANLEEALNLLSSRALDDHRKVSLLKIDFRDLLLGQPHKTMHQIQ